MIDLGGSTESNGTQRSCIKIGTQIRNIYKFPTLAWNSPTVQVVNHPANVMEEFKSHHTEWRYQDNNKAGYDVIQWAEQLNATLLYNPKDKDNFKSAHYRKEYTPDLACVIQDNKGSVQATIEVLTDFSRNQHRPTVITTGIIIPRIAGIPKPRWNFRKAYVEA
ncbi:RNA-directed DNA polymerase from mobile element jockey-like [Elysia marginata]|uniref:RNA-directed DNA polymerase from mobile element jockey-like n=1 Tax=Elysia marginata TaxID=1093978 RepID=A0AAV4JD14_9GAST|nr:RNA-directed DNA polymerase from mobile element jockey-like [Elysia marginata]